MFVSCSILLSLVVIEASMQIGRLAFLFFQERQNKISLKQGAECRVLCLGESTTALGGDASYPSRLEHLLNQNSIGVKFSVINKGVPGIQSSGIVDLLPQLLDQYSPHIVLVMMGVNDWGVGDIVPAVYQKQGFLGSLKIYKLFRYLISSLLGSNKKSVFLDNYSGIVQQNVIPKSQMKDLGKDSGVSTSRIIRQTESSSLARGRDLMRKGRYQDAQQAFLQALKELPDNFEAQVQIGWALQLQWKFSDAELAFKKAVAISPENEFAYSSLGFCYNAQSKFIEAETAFKKAIELNPRDRKAYIDLAQTYIQQSRFDEAEETYRQAINADSSNDQAYGGLALLYQLSHKNSATVHYFEEAEKLRLKYTNPVTINNYLRLYKIVRERGCKLVCIQYPMRSIKPIKMIFPADSDIIFIDNERTFKEAVFKDNYDTYFTDHLGGDFGHCTAKGNKLLVDNIAQAILRNCF